MSIILAGIFQYLGNFVYNFYSMDISSHIEINPCIMMGKPVIKGTRITVELILESLAAGESADNLLLSYPRLTKEGISLP